MNRLTYRIVTSERFETLLDKAIKLCDEQKHDPKLRLFTVWYLVLFLGAQASRHFRDPSGTFWKPMTWFLVVLFLAADTTRKELRWIRAQRLGFSEQQG